jgi:hypothetical protein
MVVLPESFCYRVIKKMQQNESHFYHRRLIVSSAGKHSKKTDHNIANRSREARPIITLEIHTLHTHILHHDWKRKSWQSQQTHR